MSTTIFSLENHRPEQNPKLDTSLEQALQENAQQNTSFSCSISLDPVNSDRSGCQHKKLILQDNFNTCSSCGSFVPQNGVNVFKNEKNNYNAFFPSKTIYETLIKRSPHFNESHNQEYAQIRQTYVEWILELAEKLRISFNSTHLGVLLMDIVMFKDSSLTAKLQLFAPICLLLAAKTIELDERIPYIPKLRKYAGSSFSIDDYRRAELRVLDLVDWNTQFSTASEITEFLMCQGFIFSNDIFEENLTPAKTEQEALRENTQHENTNHLENKSDEKKSNEKEKEQEKTVSVIPSTENNTNENVQSESKVETDKETSSEPQSLDEALMQCELESQEQTETQNLPERKTEAKKGKECDRRKAQDILRQFDAGYIKLSTLILRDIEFIQWEQKVIAASIVAFFRGVNKITPVWNENLESMTQIQFQQISTCYELITKKYNISFNTQNSPLKNVLHSSENANKDLSSFELKPKPIPTSNDKIDFNYHRVELASRTNIDRPENKTFLVGNNMTLSEKKSTSTYQPRTNVIPPALPTNYNHLRDDLRLKTTKYPNGTINTEIPHRQFTKNNIVFPSNYHSSRPIPHHEYSTGGSNYLGRNSINGGYLAPENHNEINGKSEHYNYKNPTTSLINNSTQMSSENRVPYHSRVGLIKK